MTIKILPSVARGNVTLPASKSEAHRALICAALAQGTSLISAFSVCDDTLATAECLQILGATIEMRGDCCDVTGGIRPGFVAGGMLPCRQSASTLRFLLPLALLSGEPVVFSVDETLAARPLSVFEAFCRENGAVLEKKAGQIIVSGALRPGKYAMPGDVSSQFISGFLFALPLLCQDSDLLISTPLESQGYLSMTIEWLRAFGVSAAFCSNGLHVPGGQSYRPGQIRLSGDESLAANFHALNALGGSLKITNTNPSSTQPDALFPSLAKALSSGCPTISLKDTPDLGPIAMALAALLNGARFTDVRRLRWKESDRIGSMKTELEKTGARIELSENECVVLPPLQKKTACAFDVHGDHRVAMALAVVSTIVGGTIRGAECVAKSAPAFFDLLKQAGVNLREEEV